MQASSPADFDALADVLLRHAGARRVFAFSGELGAGKTTFIQALCRRLGVVDAATSPTFALINEYQIPERDGVPPRPVYHLDLYRLRDIDEALALASRSCSKAASTFLSNGRN
jgi:tRNA threonylcarbamoyladenosine biosynthesis protein TsaE